MPAGIAGGGVGGGEMAPRVDRGEKLQEMLRRCRGTMIPDPSQPNIGTKQGGCTAESKASRGAKAEELHSDSHCVEFVLCLPPTPRDWRRTALLRQHC